MTRDVSFFHAVDEGSARGNRAERLVADQMGATRETKAEGSRGSATANTSGENGCASELAVTLPPLRGNAILTE
jgi:hypothetical protein